MLVIDTAFLGRVSEVTLGAAAIGGVFYLCLVMLGTGFAVGAQIMIGRRNGAGEHYAIGQIFDHAMVILSLLAVVLWFFLDALAPLLLKNVISSEAVLQESLTFLQFRKYGLLFGFLVLGFNGLYVGSTQTKVLSLSTFVMAMFNIILDYALIFGHWGLPAMGIAGAALATNMAEFFAFVFYLTWTIKKQVHIQFHLWRQRSVDMVLLRSLLRLSVPVMFQYFLSFAAWFVFFMIIEQLGETALAASNITRSIYMVLMIPVWGLSVSVNTLVSNTLGRGATQLVIPVIRRVLYIGLIINLFLVLFLWIFPQPLVAFYTDDPHLIEATLPLLRVVAFALIAFAIGMILFSGLSGTGKTLLALKLEVLSIMFYLVTALVLAVYFNASAPILWMVEVVYFSLMGLFAFIALKRGSWKDFSI